MSEYVSNAVQTVAAGGVALFSDSIPCSRGAVYHRDGSGIFTLKGCTTSCAFARYQVTFTGNIAVPSTGTAGAISVALAIDGEPILTSTAISTPADESQYNNVTSVAIITVPKGCCQHLSVQNTSTQSIEMQNAELIISRIA